MSTQAEEYSRLWAERIEALLAVASTEAALEIEERSPEAYLVELIAHVEAGEWEAAERTLARLKDASLQRIYKARHALNVEARERAKREWHA